MDYEQLYFQAKLIRVFEERVNSLYKEGLIAGFCHLYIGQEAIAVGCKSLMKDGDIMITTYRDHGHAIVCGIPLREIMCELLGKKHGISKGKGGSMHMFSKKFGFMGGHGIVGTVGPLGAGISFFQKYKKTSAVTLAFVGDGAMNQGQMFESFNLASLYKLPVLYVIEDNGYAIGTSKNRSSAGGDLYKRAAPFGIEGLLADGMDIDAVITAAKTGIDYVRSNSKPFIIQFETYRFRGHSVSDATRLYRTREEEQEVMSNKDCILILAEKISENSRSRMDDEIERLVEDAVTFAINDAEPDVSELYTDLYVS